MWSAEEGGLQKETREGSVYSLECIFKCDEESKGINGNLAGVLLMSI